VEYNYNTAARFVHKLYYFFFYLGPSKGATCNQAAVFIVPGLMMMYSQHMLLIVCDGGAKGTNVNQMDVWGIFIRLVMLCLFESPSTIDEHEFKTEFG
jgi:hypothetical protein